MDIRPAFNHFDACPPPLGGQGLCVSIGPIAVAIGGLDEALADAARARYRPFLSDAAPLHSVALHAGSRAYLDPTEDGYLRLEEFACGPGRCFLSNDFAALRIGGSGILRVARPSDVAATLQAVENYVRWVVADLALEHEGFVLHAAGLVRDGRAHLFFGPSGAGKSTVASLSPGCRLLSDDLVLLLRREGSWRAATTPFAGTLPQEDKEPGLYPLASLCRLVQASEDRLEALAPTAKAVAALLACCPFVTDQARRNERLLPLVEELCRAVPPRLLHFTKSPAFWSILVPGADHV